MASATAKQYKAAGEDTWKSRTEKVNAELFALTYGALVVQLVKDYEDYGEVNAQLEKMGYNMGTRLIEDLLARTNLNLGRCTDFRDVGEAVSKIGFKTFLNITPVVTHSSPEGSISAEREASAPLSNVSATPTSSQSEFLLTLEDNPLADFVELPADALGRSSAAANALSDTESSGRAGLWYSNVLAGVIRGALEMVQLQVEANFLSDILRGDEATVIRVRLIRHLEEEAPVADD